MGANRLDEQYQLFLQSCMSRRAFSEATGAAVLIHCWEACGLDKHDAPSYSEAVDDLNTAVEPFGFQLKRFQDEHTGQPWTIFINQKSDELAKVATEYSAQEIAYFRTLIKLIMKSGRRFAISGNDAKNAGRNAGVRPELKLAEAEKVLRTFVARGWLVGISVKNGTKKTDMYQLSSRARAELQYYLIEEYPNQMDKAYECKTCSEHVMKGVQCSTEGCKARMHDHCAKALFSRNRKVCPVCKNEWDDEEVLVVGPEAPQGAGVVSDDESEVDEDEEDPTQREGGDEENGEASSSAAAKRTSKTKASSKGKGKGRAIAEDEAEDDDMAVEEEAGERRASRRGSTRQAATQQDRLGNESDEEIKNVVNPQDDDDEDEDEEVDELDEEDEDDPMAVRRAAEKEKEKAKKRKAKGQPAR